MNEARGRRAWIIRADCLLILCWAALRQLSVPMRAELCTYSQAPGEGTFTGAEKPLLVPEASLVCRMKDARMFITVAVLPLSYRAVLFDYGLWDSPMTNSMCHLPPPRILWFRFFN